MSTLENLIENPDEWEVPNAEERESRSYKSKIQVSGQPYKCVMIIVYDSSRQSHTEQKFTQSTIVTYHHRQSVYKIGRLSIYLIMLALCLIIGQQDIFKLSSFSLSVTYVGQALFLSMVACLLHVKRMESLQGRIVLPPLL